MTTFKDLGLAEPLLLALAAEGYETPTPIQERSIPPLLERRDVLGIAQTGTGKTAAFALPILHSLITRPGRMAPKTVRNLILTPTRELASQISDGFSIYGRNVRHRRTVVIGGVGQVPQVRALAGGIDVLIACPGRLLDLMDQGHVRLDLVETVVLDEADRMLDMGFIHAVRKIASRLPPRRQTLLFSATMPDAVADLAAGLLNDPLRVEVTPVSSTVERIDQKVMFVSRENKRSLLADVLSDASVRRAIVFTRTKHGANRVAEVLEKSGIPSDAIHGNKSQSARQKALNSFRDGSIRALVATDIAARGIDVEGVTHVINFELPNEPESYVHRIGRTARAGAEGVAVSFCDAEEVAFLRQIERIIRQTVPVDTDHAWHAEPVALQHQQGTGRGGPARPRAQHHGRPGAKANNNGGRPASAPGKAANGERSERAGRPAAKPQQGFAGKAKSGNQAASRHGAAHGHAQRGRG